MLAVLVLPASPVLAQSGSPASAARDQDHIVGVFGDPLPVTGHIPDHLIDRSGDTPPEGSRPSCHS
jgi:hypothetical protein